MLYELFIPGTVGVKPVHKALREANYPTALTTTPAHIFTWSYETERALDDEIIGKLEKITGHPVSVV